MSDKLLYDIVQLHDWPTEEIKPVEESHNKSFFQSTYDCLISNYRRTQHLLRLAGLPYKQANSHAIVNALYQIKQNKQWTFSISPNSLYIVILQTQKIEVRSLDEELTVHGIYNISSMYIHEKQIIAWNKESNLFAVAITSRKVSLFDISCTMLCTIEISANKEVGDVPSFNICSLIMMSPRTQKDLWHVEIFVVLRNGLLLNYFASSVGEFQLYHTFNFGSSYTQGITNAFIDSSSRLLVIGGNSHCGYVGDGKITADIFGITKWRILSDFPYYKKDLSEHTEMKDQLRKGLVQRAYLYTTSLMQRMYSTPMDGVFTMSLSPDQNKLVAIHFNGSLSLWDFPSLRLRNMWMLEEQPCYNEVNPSMSSRFGRKRRVNDSSPADFYPCDVSWWNSECVTVSRCSGCLTILSVTGSDLSNLLGDHCEWVTRCCQITSAYEERFYMLECENTYSCPNKKRKVNDEEDSDDDDDDIDESDSYLRKGAHYLKLVTGIAKSKPKNRSFSSKHSLVALTKTTPQELYDRKLDDKEFGEALSIAQAYNLDCDKVFQRQWRNASITRASIQDYLAKVSNRIWVFRECTDRVPERIDDMKELIDFALRLTDVDQLARISNNDIDPDFEVEELEDYEGFDYKLQQEREIEKRLHFEKEWRKHVDFKKLSLEQNEMIKCRQRVMKYKDRLSTYIRLNGGHDAASERYTAEEFALFRKRDLFELALEYVRSSKWECFDTLMQYHSDQLKSHWLPLLSNFPETMSPNTYSCLLPEVLDGSVVEFETFKHRSVIDWCEGIDASPPMLEVEEFYDENEDLIKFRTENLTPDLVSDWFKHRATEMEKLSHLTEDALCLLDLGCEKGVLGLDQLHFNLKTLDNLLFECGCDLSLSLNELLKKTPLERIRLMMVQSVAATYVDDIQRIVIPFVKKFEDENLFQSYLLETAQKDLVLPLVVFKHILTHISSDFDFKNTSHVIETALGCIYAKEEADQLDIASRILQCIPKLDGTDKILQDKVIAVQSNLECCKILSKYKQQVTPNELRTIGEDKKQILLLFKRLTRTTTREKALSGQECENLLQDITSIATKAFSDHVDKVTCIHTLIESLLASGIAENIRLAGDKMIRSENESSNPRMGNRLPYQDSVSLVLSASREFFDAASIPITDNQLIQTSRLCLLLITDHPPLIQEQMNLIEAVALLSAFQLEMLPLEVRLCNDRLDIVKKVLDLNPNNYLKIESILRLSSLLSDNTLSKEELKGRTLSMIATKAFENGDMKTAMNVIQELIEMNHCQCWKLCVKIATCKEITDLTLRHSCISFACCYCDDRDLTSISQTHRNITASLLEQTLEEEMMKMEEEDVNGKHEGPNVIPSLIPGSHTLRTSAQLLAGTMQATTGVLRSGWSMLKNDRVQSSEPFLSLRGDVAERKKDFEIPSFPSFYKSILPTADNDLYDVITGNAFLDNSSLVTVQQQMMLRISALASMRDRMEESLTILATQTLTSDLPLALSYLLSLPQKCSVSDCFQSLPFTSLSQQVQVYFHAMQLLSKSSAVSLQPLSIYRVSPLSLISQAIKYCYNARSSHELHQAVASLVTFIQGERLTSLGQDVDMRRCSIDHEYIQDTVQGLAMTTNEEQLLVAILLADQKSCDIWQVVIAYVEHLFTETDKPVNEEDLFEGLNRLKLLPLLVSRKDDLYERFDSRVLPLIDGRSHSTLLSYFRILTSCGWKDNQSFNSSTDLCSIPPDEHISYLKQISKLAPGLDYKLLVAKCSSKRVIDLLREQLNSENVPMFSELVPKIPYQNDRITKSTVLRCWMCKHFWSNEDETKYEGDWLKRLESLNDWFQQLNISDTKSFFEEVLFSKKSVDIFSYKLRSQILKFAIRVVKGKETSIERDRSELNRYKDELERLKSHFNVFSNPFVRDIIKSADHDHSKRVFLDKFDESRSQINHVIPIAVEQAYNSIKFTKKFLSVLPHVKLSFNQVFKTCNADVVRKLSEAEDDSERKTALSYLERLLSSIGECDEKEQKKLFDSVVQAIQDFCNLDTVEISLKINVLQLLRKSAALSRKQAEFLLHHRTAELIRVGWREEVAQELLQDDEKISNDNFQRRLVTSLLERGSSLVQIQHLSNIVDILTQNKNNQSCDEMWLKVLLAFSSHQHEGGNEIVDEAKKRSFSSKITNSVFEALSSECLVLAAVKFALISKLPGRDNDIQKLLQTVTKVGSNNCDDELLRLLVDNNMVALTLSSLYYHRVVQFLTDGNCENAEEKVDSLVRQLQDSGYVSEAATLLLRYRGSHTTFATFGTSISLISNWLKNY